MQSNLNGIVSLILALFNWIDHSKKIKTLFETIPKLFPFENFEILIAHFQRFEKTLIIGSNNSDNDQAVYDARNSSR